MATATAAPSAVAPELPPYPEKHAFRDRGRVRAEVFYADADAQERLADRVEAALDSDKFDSAREMRVNELLPELDRRAHLYFTGQEAASPGGKPAEYHAKYHATKAGRKEFRKKVKKLDKLLIQPENKSVWEKYDQYVTGAAGALIPYLMGRDKDNEPIRARKVVANVAGRLRGFASRGSQSKGSSSDRPTPYI